MILVDKATIIAAKLALLLNNSTRFINIIMDSTPV